MLAVLDIFIIFIVSSLGPVLGSFFTATIMRETGLTKAHGTRSHCDNCGEKLVWWELIPIFSFLILRGKCKVCGKPIEPRLFWAEVIGLLYFFILGVFISELITKQILSIEIVILIVVQIIAAMLLLYLAIYDLLTMTIPSKVTNWFVIFAVAVNSFILLINLSFSDHFQVIGLGRLDNLLAGLIAGAAVGGLIFLTRQKGMGVGDLYLAVIIGLLLGLPGIVTAFYAIVLSSATVGLMYAYYKKQYRGLLVPLVPFIGFGYMVAVAWGDSIFELLFIQI